MARIRKKSAKSSNGKSGIRGYGKIDRQGRSINAQVWTRLRGDRDYTVIAEFENDKFGAYVEWLGIGENEKIVPREYWKLFKAHVYNIILSGDRPGSFVKKKVPDPDLTSTFSNEKDAVAYYEGVLLEAGLAEVEEDYEGNRVFAEKNNRLAKAKAEPDTLDKPHTTAEVAGSW